MARHWLIIESVLKGKRMVKPARKRSGQLSVRLDDNLLDEYKQFLEQEGKSIREDIESYVMSRVSTKQDSNLVDFNTFNELAKKVLSIEEKLGKLQAS